ncbi:hypothetical protein AAKU67_000268 [Oxalobacteraceae bacterium GrIS 2.11]
MSTNYFHRIPIAKKIAEFCLSEDGKSGLFISAPRRTGKSTLITEDIIPLMRDAQAEVIYVDLWTDKTRDPGDLISEAIRDYLHQREGLILRWARKGGLDKINLAGIQLDINKVGIGTGKTIAKALAELSDASKKMIVLVIDEAQHAITSKAGESALFALKAARDQLNGSAHFGFRLIATGSNRDKLSLLIHGKEQAFLNAVFMDLEPLGEDYLAWELNRYSDKIKPSMAVLGETFQTSGNKPESLRKALNELRLQTGVDAANVDTVFLGLMRKKSAEEKQVFMQEFNGLPAVQAAVVVVMAWMGDDFAPFRPQTIQYYSTVFKQLSGTKMPDAKESNIQYALEALREKSMIWKSARGVYAIEDTQHRTWLREEFTLEPQAKIVAKSRKKIPLK